MKKLYLLFLGLVIGATVSYSQVKVIAHMSKVSTDTTLYQDPGSAARGSWVADDIDGNGKPELIMTDYSRGGRVHVFESVGQDSVEMVWSSPVQASDISGGDSPRCIRVGDLDGDGKQEIYFPTHNGIYVYEWDGVQGSGNFGTSYSQIINDKTCQGLPTAEANRIEAMWIGDLYGNGKQELVTVWNNHTSNGSADQLYLAVISASGSWSTNNPGFSHFNLDYSIPFTSKLGGGQPIEAFVGDFDGSGKKNIIIHTWNHLNVFPVRVTGVGQFAIPDTTQSTGAYLNLMDVDGVALLGGVSTDIDNDGVDEIYLPVYFTSSADDIHNGQIYEVSYPKNGDLSKIDSTNGALIANSPATELAHNKGFAQVLFGGDWADMNNDGQKELYFGSSYPADVIQLNYLGGDKMKMANWKASIYYSGESDVYSSITYNDSLGTVDTVKTVNKPFVSKLFAENMDFNGDGKPDILLPYQGLVDSTSLTWKHYDTGQGKFIQDSTGKIPNPKIWYGRILESQGATGVKAENLVFVTPTDYKLNQNYPNPFNPTTTIGFYLPLTKQISMKVYDITGRVVKTLIDNESFAKGNHKITWDGTNNFGQKVASGNYICQMKFGNFTKSIKMTLLK
jgi:hypothetical protein